jgi:TPR repeat protein/tRNA A-37 threonylcarbamoyl transferase component Bud32
MTTPRMIGQYEITELLGEGGIGQVYAARDTVLGREVAIKSLRPAMLADESFVERFRAEAINLARLNHQNITTLYSLTQEEAIPYMVMELVRGQTLDVILQGKDGHFAVNEALAIIGQAADGLAYAHAHDVIHRDVKPSNLMITDAGLLKIMDFGIARLQGSQHLTRDGSIVGTLAYMAPEQLRSEETDERSDLYSLAIVLYEMLSGSVPFAAASDYDLMRAQISDPPDRIGKRIAGLDAHIDNAIMKALSKKPSDRYPSVSAFKDALGGSAAPADSVTIVQKATRLIGTLPASISALPAAAAAAVAAPERSSIFVAVRGIAVGATLALAATGAFLLFRSGGSPSPEVAATTKDARSAASAPVPVAATAPPSAASAGGGRPSSASPSTSPAIAPLSNPYQFGAPGSRAAAPAEEARTLPLIDTAPSRPAEGMVTPSRSAPPGERSAALSPPALERTPAALDVQGLKRLCDAAAASPFDKDRPRSITTIPSDKIDPSIAVPACEAAVKAAPDDGRMLLQLGRSYGAAKDYGKAMAAYRRADELGNVLATNNIGALYSEGLGVKQDKAEARTWFQRAASEGLAFAMKNIGELYQSGTGGQQNYELARQWYERAASAGDVEAMRRLGSLHEGGLGVTKDPAEAHRWYEKAALAGDPRAMVDLAELYREGSGVPKNPAEAWRWYDKAASAGNANAMFMLGVFNNNGIAVAKAYPEARRWYEKAAALGHPVAMNNLGVLYADGAGVPKDYSEARRWYEKAAAAGNAMAMVNIGFLYQHGYGVPVDRAEARRWYEKAVAAGETRLAPEALRKLGRGR